MAKYQPGPGGPMAGGPGGFATYKKPKAAPVNTWGNPPPAVAAAVAGQNVSTPAQPFPINAPQTAVPQVAAPAAAPVAAPTPQYTPQYTYQSAPVGDILATDPFYQQMLGLNKATSQEEQAWMRAQIHRQQGYYGSESDPLSVFGRIGESYQDALRNVNYNLASRGMIFSGELGAQNNRARLGYERQKLDANMRLQDYIEGLKKGFADAERARKQNELQSSLDAVTRWLNTHPPTLTNPQDFVI